MYGHGGGERNCVWWGRRRSCRRLFLNHGELFHLSVIEGRPDVTKIQRVVCLCLGHCVFISSGEEAWRRGRFEGLRMGKRKTGGGGGRMDTGKNNSTNLYFFSLLFSFYFANTCESLWLLLIIVILREQRLSLSQCTAWNFPS